jgi:sugar O-acyltransferase (sialic acid O-acetyltransferase NeuD family)|tara:strand:+ start:1540 stop:2121 length:582 start_codon:yes stop_codon:yes gene_type:complete
MKKAIFGYGGHAREVAMQMGGELTFFVDDEYSNNFTKPLSEFDPLEYEILVAIANPGEREEIVNRLPPQTEFTTFIHPTAIISQNFDVIIGEGSFIGANSIITTNINIGKHALLNRGNHIGHDCIIGNYLSMMPGSIISGNVIIGNNVYLGTNSSIKEKLFINDDVVIGLNSGVVNNITKPGVYVGTPAKLKN